MVLSLGPCNTFPAPAQDLGDPSFLYTSLPCALPRRCPLLHLTQTSTSALSSQYGYYAVWIPAHCHNWNRVRWQRARVIVAVTLRSSLPFLLLDTWKHNFVPLHGCLWQRWRRRLVHYQLLSHLSEQQSPLLFIAGCLWGLQWGALCVQYRAWWYEL